MHDFCDSPKHIYSDVVYLRIKASVGVGVRFIFEKTKVPPLKYLSILRLDLLRCVLLSKLISEICSAISSRLLIDNRLFGQIQKSLYMGKEKSWTPSVENRVLEVRKDVDRCKWSHAAGEEKPADIPTTVRGRDESDK